MSKYRFLLLFVLAVFAFTITSCSKDDDDDSNESRKELLLAKKWKISTVTVAGLDVTNDFFNECAKDDYAVFNSDGTGERYGATNKCDPAEPAALPFTWTMSSDEKTITFLGQTYSVASMNSTTLVATQVEAGITFTYTFTGF